MSHPVDRRRRRDRRAEREVGRVTEGDRRAPARSGRRRRRASSPSPGSAWRSTSARRASTSPTSCRAIRAARSSRRTCARRTGKAAPARSTDRPTTFAARGVPRAVVADHRPRGGWRLGYLIVAKADQPLLLNDSIYFSIQAGLNSEGQWFEDALTGQPGAEHGMLTSLYLTPWSIGGGDSVFPQRLGDDAARDRHRLRHRHDRPPPDARHWASATAERVGLIAAGDRRGVPQPVDQRLAGDVRDPGDPARRRWRCTSPSGITSRPTVASGALLGLLAGLGALTRSEIVLFIPGFAVLSWLVCRRRRLSVVAGSGDRRRRRGHAAAVEHLQPDAVRRAGAAEHERRQHAARRQLRLAYYDDVGGWDIRCLGPLAPGRDASQRSTERRDAALDYVADHADRLPVVVAARFGRLLDVYGLGSLVSFDVGEEKARWAVWAGIVAWWLLAVAAVVGWATASTGQDRWALVAARAVHRRRARRRCCSTGPTGSGPRPSRRSCCSPPSASG